MKQKLGVILAITLLVMFCVTPVLAAEVPYDATVNADAKLKLRAYTASYDVDNDLWKAGTPITSENYLKVGDYIVVDLYAENVSGAFFVNTWLSIDKTGIVPIDATTAEITEKIFVKTIKGTDHLSANYLNILDSVPKNSLDDVTLKLEGGCTPSKTDLSKVNGIIGTALFKVKTNGSFIFNSVDQIGDDNITHRPYLSWSISGNEDRHTLPINSLTINVGTPPVKVTGVTVDKPSVTLKVGGSGTVTATVSPTDAANKTVSWQSSNTNVVTVSTGADTTVATLTPGTIAGNATITVTTADGSKTATCSVTVEVPVTGVTLDNPTMSLVAGGIDGNLQATIVPGTASNQGLTWSSEHETIATVTAGATGTATVHPLIDGTTVITVRTADGSKTATCTVTVSKAPIRVTNVNLNEHNITLTVSKDTAELNAIVTPNDANKAVTWSISPDDIATVVSTGDSTALVTPLKQGSAVITVTTVDTNASGRQVTDTCSLTVNPAPISVAGVYVDPKLTLIKGIDGTLIANVLPGNATNQAVTWESDNASVATVTYTEGAASKTATITPIGKGTANITVKTADGNFTATCIVTVDIAVSGVTLDKDSLTMLLDGSTNTLTATIDPSIANNQNLIWSIDKDSVVDLAYSADKKVVTITTKALGTVTVTVKTEDGNLTDSCVITVNPVLVTGVALTPPTDNLYFGGPTYKLSHTIYPDNATDKSVIWSSYREDIATVSENGEVSPLDKGTSTITVSTGVYSATCDVTVVSPLKVVDGSFNITDYKGNAVSTFESNSFYYINVKLHDLIDKNFTPLTIIQVKDNNGNGKVVEFDTLKSTVHYSKNSTDGDIELSAGFRLPVGSGSYQAQLYVWSNWISAPGERHLTYNEPTENVFSMAVSEQ